jgi:hypothetical protein
MSFVCITSVLADIQIHHTVTVTVTDNLLRHSSYREAPPFPLSIWTIMPTCSVFPYTKVIGAIITHTICVTVTDDVLNTKCHGHGHGHGHG